MARRISDPSTQGHRRTKEAFFLRVLTSPEKPRERPRKDTVRMAPRRLSVWDNTPAAQGNRGWSKPERFHPCGNGRTRVHAVGIYPVVHLVYKPSGFCVSPDGPCDALRLGVQPVITVHCSLSPWTLWATVMPSSTSDGRDRQHGRPAELLLRRLGTQPRV